jgi:large subunit ribosomal protein L2
LIWSKVMSLKVYRPVTPGQRGTVLVNRAGLWKSGPLKTLTVGLRKTGGRNAHGRLTAYHRGGGHKRVYRMVDFKRSKEGKAVVERIEYDPNRTAHIALIKYDDGTYAYILAPQKLAIGDFVASGLGADIKPGNAMPLKAIPSGTFIHNVELKVGKGAQLVRSAGCFARVMARDGDYVLVQLSSGEVRRVLGRCWASIGALSNKDLKNESLGKAGRNRWRGWRPHVRGVAMNPIDHPHGGGEGKTSGGRHPVTPWGVSTKGKKTRRNKRTDVFIVKRRKS